MRRITIDCICVVFCICGFVCKWLYTRLIQSIRVLSGYDYICLVDWYSITATTSIIFLSSVVTLVYIYFI